MLGGYPAPHRGVRERRGGEAVRGCRLAFPAGNARKTALGTALPPVADTNVMTESLDDLDDTLRLAMTFIRSGGWPASASWPLRAAGLGFAAPRGKVSAGAWSPW